MRALRTGWTTRCSRTPTGCSPGTILGEPRNGRRRSTFANYISDDGIRARRGPLREHGLVTCAFSWAREPTPTPGASTGTPALTGRPLTGSWTVTAGVRVSAHVPAVNWQQAERRCPARMRRDMVAPIWEGVTIIPDDVTKAAKGEIVITAVMLYALKLLRSDGFHKQADPARLTVGDFAAWPGQLEIRQVGGARNLVGVFTYDSLATIAASGRITERDDSQPRLFLRHTDARTQDRRTRWP